jgi:hypothetical protein
MNKDKDLVISNNIKNNVRTVDLEFKNINTGNKAYVQAEDNGFANISDRNESDIKENANQLDSKGTYENKVSTYREKEMYVPKSNEIICKDKKTDKDYGTINRKKKYDVAQKSSVPIRPNTKDGSVYVDHVKKVTWADVVKKRSRLDVERF